METRKDNVLKYGLTAGFLIVLVMVIAYFLDKKLMISSWVYWGTLLFQLIAMYMCVMNEKQKSKLPISIEETLKIAFPVFVLSNIVYHVFYFVFMNYIDHGMVELTRQTYLADMQNFATNQADPTKKMENQSFEVTLFTSFFSFSQGCIGGFILSGIVAFFTKED